jgi:hypothetical protein
MLISLKKEEQLKRKEEKRKDENSFGNNNMWSHGLYASINS